MIEISFGKLLLLALIALIVLGPEKLPGAARTAGALIRRLRLSWDSVRAEVERELQVEEIRRTARESVARMDAAQAELDATLKEVHEVADGVAAGVADAAAATADPPLDVGRPDAAGTGGLAQPAGERPAVVPADPSSAAPAAVDAPTATTDTHTGDLFAGTTAAAPPAVTPVPAERVDGVA
ncbi:MAG TPA: Sec-independent protein translocase protein TatB [Rhodanobacter sp.]|jgi:sec-independent protein translocase protein TatB|nr:Sec-independent protein translocase protein TatB [Rhodanobacter sp.]